MNTNNIKQEIVDLAKQLISVKSIQGNPEGLKQVLDISKKFINKDNRRYRSEGVLSDLYANQDTKHFRLLLNAHLDVVPASDEMFEPRLEEGKLYGRGAYDMTAGGAVEMLAFRDFADKVDYPLGLQLVTDEEIGGFNGTLHQVQEGISADFSLVGEPTNLNIGFQSKGVMRLAISTKGVNAHASLPWEGDNAILKIKAFVDDVLHKYPIPDEPEWVTTVNVARIETSNKADNKVPADCTVYLDIRYVPELSETIEDEIRELLPKDSELEIGFKEPCQYTDPKQSDVQALKRIVKEHTGTEPELISNHYATDLRHFTRNDMPAVSFGPIGDGLHADHEWVDIDSLVTYYELLGEYLLSL